MAVTSSLAGEPTRARPALHAVAPARPARPSGQPGEVATMTRPDPVGREVGGGPGGLLRLATHLTLAGLPLLAISAHVFELLPMHLAAALVVLPLTLAVLLLALFAPITEERIVLRGAMWGALATLIYDVFRLDTVYLLGWWGDFIPTMGTWVLGLEPDAQAAGAVAGYVWRYAGDGAGIGSVFFVLVAATGLRRLGRRRLVAVATAFAVFPVWTGLIATVGLAPRGQQAMFPLTPTTITLSLIGHLIFGVVLGLGCARCRDLERDWPWPPLLDLDWESLRGQLPRAGAWSRPALAPGARPAASGASGWGTGTGRRGPLSSVAPLRSPLTTPPGGHPRLGDEDAATVELDLSELTAADARGLTAASSSRTDPARARMPWHLVLIVTAVLLVPLAITAVSNGADGALQGLSVQLGVLACSLLVLVVLVASRLRRLYRAWGVELVMRAHRILGTLVIVVIGGHIVAAVAHSPRGWALLNPLSASNAVLAGMAATAAVVLTALVFARGSRSRPRHATRRSLHIALAGYTLIAVGGHVVDLDRLVTTPAARAWMAGLSAAVLLVGFVRWIWRPLRSLPYLVEGVRPESDTTFTLSLSPPAHGPGGMHFQAGQFVWLRRRRLPMLGEEHPFTISSSAERPGRLEFTIEQTGRFTRALRGLRPGERVWLDGPHGSFTEATATGTGLVLIAGGSGLSPMLSMLRTLADRGDTRRHTLLFSQPRGQRLFEAELATLHRRLDNLHIEFLQGRWVDPALLGRVLPAGREHELDYFVCGPPALVDGALTALSRVGVGRSAVRTERFSPGS